MKELLKSTSNTAIWHSSWTTAPFSHIISSGESFQSGSHEPVPFTVKVREMPSNLCDSLWYYKSVGCGDIFRCLLLGAEEKSLSCLQVRKINQEVNAAFVESRKYCIVKFFISSKSLINIYMSGISAHPSYSHNFLYFHYRHTKINLVSISNPVTENIQFPLWLRTKTLASCYGACYNRIP